MRRWNRGKESEKVAAAQVDLCSGRQYQYHSVDRFLTCHLLNRSMLPAMRAAGNRSELRRSFLEAWFEDRVIEFRVKVEAYHKFRSGHFVVSNLCMFSLFCFHVNPCTDSPNGEALNTMNGSVVSPSPPE